MQIDARIPSIRKQRQQKDEDGRSRERREKKKKNEREKERSRERERSREFTSVQEKSSRERVCEDERGTKEGAQEGRNRSTPIDETLARGQHAHPATTKLYECWQRRSAGTRAA